MAVEIVTVPDLGGAESVDVIELSVAPGDAVEVEDSLLVLESDKATMDVPSPFQGSLVKYLVADGDRVAVGDAIAEIDVADGAAEADVESELLPAQEPQPGTEPQLGTEPQPVVEPQPAKAPDSASSIAAEQLIVVPDIGSDDEIDVIEIYIKL